jgi:hypothetical protein
MTHALQKINIPNSKIAKIVGIFLRMFFLKGYLEKDRYKYWYSILIHSGCWIHGTLLFPLYFIRPLDNRGRVPSLSRALDKRGGIPVSSPGCR